MLKILVSTQLARARKRKVEVGSNGKDKLDSKDELTGRDEVGNNEIDSNKVGDDEIVEEKNH